MTSKESQETELPLSEIDPSPAEAVRASTNQDAVDRYAEAEERGERLPPVDVFASAGGKCYLGDGGHRYKAMRQLGRTKIRAMVRQYATDREAHAAAVRHAAGANALHGLPRSPEDKRAAVRSVISRPEYADTSDTAIAEICRVSHVLVRLVREQMTAQGVLSGPAAATSRPYKQGAKLRGGAVADGQGRVVVPVTEQVSLSNPVARPDETSAPPPNPVGVRDGRGRVIPAGLVEAFCRGKELLRNVRQVLGGVRDAIREAASEPGGQAIAAVAHVVDSEITSVIENVSSAIPYACCPHLADDGTHRQSGSCRVCSDRGWVSRHVWRQMPDTLRDLCDRQSEEGTEREDAA